jgi:SAM-dependent methyltransferase
MSEPPADALALQRQRSHVTYTFPGPGLGPPATVTLLESRGVLSAAGTTGLRTWEAAVHLAAYLAGEGEGRAVRGKRVLELGAGTGLVALACAKALGAARVAATDGSPDVVEALRDNIFVNGLQRGGTVSAAVLRWGRWPEVDGSGPGDFDVVVGADIVSGGRWATAVADGRRRTIARSSRCWCRRLSCSWRKMLQSRSS